MERKLQITEECWTKLETAHDWLLERSVQVAENLKLEFQETVNKIVKNPTANPPFGKKYRRKMMKTFSYYIYYKEKNEQVIVTNFLHVKRNRQSGSE